MTMRMVRFLQVGLLAVLLAALVFWGYVGYEMIPKPTPTPIPRNTFDGALAFEAVQAQMNLGPRPTGSEANLETASLIEETLRALGWQVDVQGFDDQGLPARNILARMSPQPPGGRARGSASKPAVVLLGAHYDTRPLADNDPDEAKRREPAPGANDGASGVAVLLELARSLDPAVLHDEVWLAFFDAADGGRIDGREPNAGSTHMARTLSRQPNIVVVLDMVGDADQQFYLEGNSTPHYQRQLWYVAQQLGYEANFIPETKWTISDDHLPFRQAGVSAVAIVDFDYPYWHTTSDTIDKISPTSLERVGRVLEYWLEETRE